MIISTGGQMEYVRSSVQVQGAPRLVHELAGGADLSHSVQGNRLRRYLELGLCQGNV